jgi:hypothetical protein
MHVVVALHKYATTLSRRNKYEHDFDLTSRYIPVISVISPLEKEKSGLTAFVTVSRNG